MGRDGGLSIPSEFRMEIVENVVNFPIEFAVWNATKALADSMPKYYISVSCSQWIKREGINQRPAQQLLSCYRFVSTCFHTQCEFLLQNSLLLLFDFISCFFVYYFFLCFSHLILFSSFHDLQCWWLAVLHWIHNVFRESWMLHFHTEFIFERMRITWVPRTSHFKSDTGKERQRQRRKNHHQLLLNERNE